MKKYDLIMGMPIQIEIRDNKINEKDFKRVFDYFRWIDATFSPYKSNSEVGKINSGKIKPAKFSPEIKEVFKMADKTKKETAGYFDIKKPDGEIDPSGIVKGWAIKNAADILKRSGYTKFFIDAGGDVEIVGEGWTWGIRNPFNKSENVKILSLGNCGIATSGTYERGSHIYNPLNGSYEIPDIVSLTVIGENIYEADRFATPAFAMGKFGIGFIEKMFGFEGYMIDKRGIATMTSGFGKYIKN